MGPILWLLAVNHTTNVTDNPPPDSPLQRWLESLHDIRIPNIEESVAFKVRCTRRKVGRIAAVS